MIVMLIVSIMVTRSAYAQYGYSDPNTGYTYNTSTERGSGLFNLNVQSQTSYSEVKKNLTAALFGTHAQARSIFRSDLPGITSDDLMDVQGRWLKEQLGAYDPNNSSDYSIELEYIGTKEQAIALWGDYYDGYIIQKRGATLQWSEPLRSSRPFKPFYVATISCHSTGRSAKLRANCGNPLGAFNESVAVVNDGATSGTAAIVNTNTQSVVINRNPYQRQDDNAANRNTKRHGLSTGAWIGIGVGVALVTYLVYKAIQPKDTLHDPKFNQPDSGSPWNNGGNVDGQVTYAPKAFALGLH